MIYQTRSVLPI